MADMCVKGSTGFKIADIPAKEKALTARANLADKNGNKIVDCFEGTPDLHKDLEKAVDPGMSTGAKVALIGGGAVAVGVTATALVWLRAFYKALGKAL